MTRYLAIVCILMAICLAGTGFGQASPQDRAEVPGNQVVRLEVTSQNDFDALRNRVSRVESKVADLPSMGLILFLFGAFCALWAQNTSRNPWLWFFLGVIFTFITVLVLLSKNATDRASANGVGQTG